MADDEEKPKTWPVPDPDPRPPPIDDPPDELESEALIDFIKRLETFSGTQRVRVPKEWLDDQGNILIPPQAVYLVDSDGAPHASATTAGETPPTSPYGIGSGNIRCVYGTYTKGATGAVGSIQVSPGTDDILYFMYGQIGIAATRVGGADQLYCGISYGNSSAHLLQTHLDDAGANANEIYWWPSLGQVNHDLPEALSGVTHSLHTMIPSGTLVNDDVGAIGNPRYLVELAGMASAEVFAVGMFFLSVHSLAPTVTLGTSDTWA